MNRTCFILASGTAAMLCCLLYVRNTFAGAPPPSLDTVDRMEIPRYIGTWHEIARIPHRFQDGCVKSSADYSLRDDGTIQVINRCRDEKTGELREAKGRAWPIDESNSKLKVSFFWPFRGDYWIIELGKEYEYSVVGAPNRNYLWILSRKPEMDLAVYTGILERLRKKGFDTDRLVTKP